jgi:hypothetical protein
MLSPTESDRDSFGERIRLLQFWDKLLICFGGDMPIVTEVAFSLPGLNDLQCLPHDSR